MLREFIRVALADNSPMVWAAAAVTLCLAVPGLLITTRMLASWLRRSDARSSSRWHHLLTDMALRTNPVFHLAMGLWAAAQWLNIASPWRERLKGTVLAVVMIQLGLWMHRSLKHAIDGLMPEETSGQGHGHRASHGVMRFFGTLVIWSGVLLLTLENLGINVSALVAGFGITGAAVVLATQTLVSDLFASISIILDKPFLVGDFVILDGGFQGTVERIGVRTTRMRSLSGEQLVFANSDLSKSRTRNFRTLAERRIVFAFTLRYETPMDLLEKVSDLVERAVQGAGDARFDRAEMLSFGESGLGFECVYFVQDPSYNVYTATQQRINFAIMRAFAKHEIQFAYRTTLVLRAADLADSGRAMAA